MTNSHATVLPGWRFSLIRRATRNRARRKPAIVSRCGSTPLTKGCFNSSCMTLSGSLYRFGTRKRELSWQNALTPAAGVEELAAPFRAATPLARHEPLPLIAAMKIILLGTAAGGGVPQWNCNCANCREARRGRGGVLPRTQSSVAVSADGRRWFLLNASPDLRGQLEGFSPLHPSKTRRRSTPIEGVLVTNADLDHTLGLFLLREGEKLPVHATPRVRRTLTRGLALDRVLRAFCGVRWITPPSRLAPLLCRDGSPSGLRYQAVGLPGKPPRFVRHGGASAPGHCVGYRISDERTRGSVLFLPDVAAIDDRIAHLLGGCDVLLFDGTFWS